MADAQPTQPAQQQTVQESTFPADKIHLIVRNRNQILFNDDVQAITSKNDTGLFDILPQHTNFIALITSPLTIHRLDGQTKEIPFKNGLIKVKDSAIFCYIDLLAQGLGR